MKNFDALIMAGTSRVAGREMVSACYFPGASDATLWVALRVLLVELGANRPGVVEAAASDPSVASSFVAGLQHLVATHRKSIDKEIRIVERGSLEQHDVQ